MTAFAAAGDEFTVEGLKYKVLTEDEGNNTGTVALVGYDGTAPETLTVTGEVYATTPGGITYTVTEIGENAFEFNDKITKVEISNSVETIGEEAFAQCHSLTAFIVDGANTKFSAEDGVLYDKAKSTLIQYPSGKSFTGFTFPNNVKTIGSYAFAYMIGVAESLTIVSNVERIAENAFVGCEQLGEITFDSDSRLKTIGEGAFGECKFTEFYIPGTVISIGTGAFGYCNNLQSISISKNIESLGDVPFYVNHGLKSIDVDKDNTNYSSKNGVLYNKLGDTLLRYPANKSDTEFTIPNGVTTLAESSFYANNNLKKLTIPPTVDAIEDSTFYWATALEDIRFLGGTPPAIGIDSTFGQTNSLDNIHVPKGKVEAYKSALSSVLTDTDMIQEYTVPGAIEVTAVGDLINYLKSDSPSVIWVTTDIDLGDTSQTIEVGADHTLIIEDGRTVSTGKTNILIPENIDLTIKGRLRISAGSRLESEGYINGVHGLGIIILEEGAEIKGLGSTFRDRGYLFIINDVFTVAAADEIPSILNITAGEYIWDGSSTYHFVKEGEINWDKGYGLVVAGVRVDENNAGNITGPMIEGGGTISYDKSTQTLTLKDAKIVTSDNFYFEYGIYSRDDIRIKLEGSSTIGLKDDSHDYNIISGLYAPGRNITLVGNGSLTIYGEIMGVLGKNINVNATGNITIKEQGASGRACCLKADGGTLTINSGSLNLYSEQSNGLYGDSIVINGGSITAQSEYGTAFNKEPAFSTNYSYTVKVGSSPSDAIETTNPTFTEKHIRIEPKTSGRDNGGSGGSGGSGGGGTITSPTTDVVGKDEAVTEDKWVNPFVDVIGGNWYSEAVKYVYEKGLMKGTGGNTFSPDGMTTRGMIVTILHRLGGSLSAGANEFSDVRAENYYADAVAWASNNNIVNGYGNDKFGPEDAITREQLAVILMNYARFKGYDISSRADLSKFEDSQDISSWAKEAMSWANAEGLIQGDGNSLAPAYYATRSQVAAILYRFIEKFQE
jgi:hypothetical protein